MQQVYYKFCYNVSLVKLSNENKRPWGHIAHPGHIGPKLKIVLMDLNLIQFCEPNLPNFHIFDSALYREAFI
jgi:hypothetical protein